MKKKKLEEKVFTKKKGNDIISKDYNPFEVNCKIYERRSELHMKKNISLYEDEVLKELNLIERILFKRKFINIYKKGIQKGFNSRM